MVKKLDHNSIIPLHIQAESILRQFAASEEYKSGKLLPKEIELAKKFSISRNTLRQAINRLVFDGVLIRKRGYGTIVAPAVMLSNARNWMSFSQEMKAQGYEVGNFELHVSWKIPEVASIASFFGADNKTRLLCMERLRGKLDTPFVYFISYFNPSINLTGNENFIRPLYEILEKDFGVIVHTSKEEISAQGASVTMAEKLGIREHDPILVRKRLVYDVNNMPVEYNVGYYKADSFTYTIECKR
jgi:GntR family transcriptional regulator